MTRVLAARALRRCTCRGDEGRGQDQDSREGTWVQVRPVEGAFTVNIGDMMQVLARPGQRAHAQDARGFSTDTACPTSTGRGTRRVQLVRGEERGVPS